MARARAFAWRAELGECGLDPVATQQTVNWLHGVNAMSDLLPAVPTGQLARQALRGSESACMLQEPLEQTLCAVRPLPGCHRMLN